MIDAASPQIGHRDAHLAAREIDTIDIQARELGEAKTRRIGKLEYRAIANREIVIIGNRHEPNGFVGRQRRRQSFR